ncbi:class I SAM-dependent methyltransferase [Virgibacillus necropolis]|uniref:class I SAM-dependent methyltransferase n=1 Tax=Virgibacillus necropolis TaxID=163877 RepID=UPI00384AA502
MTIQMDSGDTCLYIRVGIGNLGPNILEKNVSVNGVGQSKKMLQLCNEKHPKIDTKKGHFLALPLVDNHVEGVVSSYALHHFPDSGKVLALQEMDRVLKDNGQICIVD